MIEPTDEMTAAALEARKHVSISTPESRMRASILAVLAIVERQHQGVLADAYQRGFNRGQHRLCPRCGVELTREVAEEVGHRYLSTACLHDEHGPCRKRCKFCPADCRCTCHADAAT